MRFGKLGLAIVVFAAGWGCDCSRLQAQAAARKVMIATVLATPEVTLKPEALAGWDGSFPTYDAGFFFDGGFPFDAGSLTFDGGLTLPAQTSVFAFFGARTGDDLSQAPTPVAMASVAVATPSHSWNLTQVEAGHVLTSNEDPSLRYEPSTTWTFTAMAEGQSFVGDVLDSPAAERVAQLHPTAGYIELVAGTPVNLTRPEPEGGKDRDLGFVTVVPIARDGSKGEPTWSNIPNTVLDFLKLAAAPGDWKRSVITVPGEAFPNADRNYVILVQSAKLGGAKSENLFIGSAMIAGVADVGVVKTR